jgi:Putative Actinobacterial Holin-X, holin superfamily III
MAEPTPTPPTSPTPPPSDSDERSVAELVFDVSERASTLVREEIELAKAEIGDKVGKILRGSVVGLAAGTFAFLALILIMHGIAWLLAEELFDGNVWPGFFVEAALFLVIAGLAGLFAYRSVQAGAPPVPEQAIEEAKQIKSTLQGEGGPATAETAAQVDVPTQAQVPK